MEHVNPDTKMLRKSVKKDASRLGWSLLLYAGISMAVAFVYMIIKVVMAFIQTDIFSMTDPAAQDQLLNDLINEMLQSAGYMIAGVIIGILVLLLIFRKKQIHKAIFQKNKSMTVPKFLQFLCVFMGGQLVFQLIFQLLESGLNLIGYTAEASMELATANSQTLSMFLYVGIIGPIAEEIVYRGFAMRSLEKHGKLLAILVSSILFGVMHCNLPQSIGAMLVGITLGYVAMEYSVIWSIVLHILNNLVFGDLLNHAISGLDESTQEILFYVIMGGFFLAGAFIIIRKRKQIQEYIIQNRWQKQTLLWTLTAVGILVFILSQLIIAIAFLERM